MQIQLSDRHRLIGKRFGELVVLEPTDQRSNRGEVLFRCLCDCGHEKLVHKSRLLEGRVLSCGCRRRLRAQLMCKKRLMDLTGKRFGRLTVLCRDGSNDQQAPLWWCYCDCGNSKTVAGFNLKSGQTQSCGCIAREVNGKRMAKLAASDQNKNVQKRLANEAKILAAIDDGSYTSAAIADATGLSRQIVNINLARLVDRGILQAKEVRQQERPRWYKTYAKIDEASNREKPGNLPHSFSFRRRLIK